MGAWVGRLAGRFWDTLLARLGTPLVANQLLAEALLQNEGEPPVLVRPFHAKAAPLLPRAVLVVVLAPLVAPPAKAHPKPPLGLPRVP